MTDACLKDCRILVVEDEYLLATELCLELKAAGAVIIGPVSNLTRALEVVAHTQDIHGAMLDINLGGELTYPVAERLQAREVAMVFMTGYDSSMIPLRFRETPLCEKPMGIPHIIRTMAEALRKNETARIH